MKTLLTRSLFTTPLIAAATLGLAACNNSAPADNGTANDLQLVNEEAPLDANLSTDGELSGNVGGLDAVPTGNETALGNAVDGNASVGNTAAH
ncbi:hypothetical protein [Sphingomonas sp. ERG5]|uniref:hypothetical protein n=1 Tax=Sphingomonas sp. ERG5 TaxID=1381597 RepID=UPI00054BF1B1|nr:hypothetical protein [Sphingomonas sp. ERG5]